MPDQFDLHGQTAIVTGGGGDIGSVIATQLARFGANVAITDIDIPAAEGAAKRIAEQLSEDGISGSIAALHMDVTDASSIDTCFDAVELRWGTCTVLVNNAIIACPIPPLPHEASDEIWDRDIDVILKGGFATARRALPPMIAARTGVIVNILSVNAHEFYGHPSYSAAKAGMRSFTQTLASVYGKDGIRAVSISPGTIRTKAWDEQLRKDPGVFDRLTAWYPLGRIGEPKDVADAVVFVSSRSASWMSGSDLVIDGGLMAGNPTMARSVQGS